MEAPVSRRQAREQAFILAFEKNFTQDPVDDIIEAALLSDDRQVDPFAVALVKAMEEKTAEIDRVIEENIKGWKTSRISKVSFALLRLSIFQILFSKDDGGAQNPVSVAINDAVRLAKKYATPEDASFINGVLGAVARTAQKPAHLPENPGEST